MTRTIRQKLGILRSVAMYYWKPFNKKRLTNFYNAFVKKGDLCFDIGAHLGNRTNAWAALGAKVVAVDPQPQCMRYLEQKFSSNPNVVLLQKAVANEPGKASFHISELTPTVSTMAAKEWQNKIDDHTSFKVTWDETISVEVITLDQLIATYGLPDFCKIDVEDFEVQVLQGLSTAIPSLSLEYFTPTLFRVFECMDLLDDLGDYEYNWSYGESQILNAEKWLSTKEMRIVFDGYTSEDRSGDIYARIKR